MYWVGQKVRLGFSIRYYGKIFMEILWKMIHKILWKTQRNFLANPVYGVIPLKKKKQKQTNLCAYKLSKQSQSLNEHKRSLTAAIRQMDSCILYVLNWLVYSLFSKKILRPNRRNSATAFLQQ